METTDIFATAEALGQKKKLHRSWSMYDWANSAYNLVITSTIFPGYYDSVTTVRDEGTKKILNDTVVFFGHEFKNSALFDYSLAAAYLIIVFLSPILSSIADYKGNKKRFLQLFCYLGAAACCGLYTFTKETLDSSMILFALAALGYCGSQVFYNAYLPEIARVEERDKLSAQGFAYGYIGSMLLQVVCLVIVLKPELFSWLGVHDGNDAARLSFLLVGVWWFAFAHIPIFVLPKGTPIEKTSEHSILTNGFHELRKVWMQVKKMSVLKTFLLSFLFYSMGVQTVMLAATLFGTKEVHQADGTPLGMPQLITTIMIIQLVAIAGAFLMAKLSEKFGNLKVLLGVVAIWVGVCVGAFFTHTDIEFYIVAAVVGLVMGGIQSLSRSTYSKLMPPTKDTASFFSFYDVTEKVAIVIGMFSFGLIDSIYDIRHSILALIAFFGIGAVIMLMAIRKAAAQNIILSNKS